MAKLTVEELVNKYNQMIRERVSEHLSEDTKQWVLENTEEIL